MTTKTLAIIQARMSSTRFPGKVLQPLLDFPLIVFMLERVRKSIHVDELMVATSGDASDDRLAETVESRGFRCFRGDLGDVLDRFYQAARPLRPEVVVRLTGDCPLMDADLVDGVVTTLVSSGADYASNVDPRTFPDGLDVECFSFAALERAWHDAHAQAEREHVTPFLRQRKDLFRSASVRGVADLSNFRWTVDYPEDLELVRELVRRAAAVQPADCDRFDFYRVMEADPVLADWNRRTSTGELARNTRNVRQTGAMS
jgi:spore coat polysaccharide biosynthesis protein SpsF (cytidylyltransferase family)